MTEFGEAYAATRRSIADMVRDLTEEEANARVPACPDWSVRDVVAHLTGIAVDATKGDLLGVGSPEWTQRQVDERKDASLQEMVAEWEEAAVQIDGALDYFPKFAASLFVGDTLTHEHDIRLPLARPGDRNAPAVALAAEGYVRWFGRRIKDRDMPAVAVKAERRRWIAGAGDPSIEVRAPSTFDLLRGLTGRRTRAEIASFEWSADPEPYLDLFSQYGMPSAPLGE